VSNPRVVKAHRVAARGVFDKLAPGLGPRMPDSLIEALCEAVITARDHDGTVWCAATRTPAGNTFIFGPYTTADAATNAINTGQLAHTEGTTGGVFPLIPAPRGTKRTTTKSKTTKSKGVSE
jgi:hypothetical protein